MFKMQLNCVVCNGKTRNYLYINNMEKVYENIKRFRIKANLKQRYVANEIGIDPSGYSRIEKGELDISLSRLAAIARVLGRNITEFFAEDQGKEEEPIEAVLQIKLRKDKKEQVLKLVFGENNLEILNK